MSLLKVFSCILFLSLVSTLAFAAEPITCPDLSNEQHPPVTSPWEDITGNTQGAHIYQKVELTYPAAGANYATCFYDTENVIIRRLGSPPFVPLNPMDWFRKPFSLICVKDRTVCTFAQ